MAWVKIDDGFAQHPKAVEAGPVGMALHLAGLCYASRYLTDGFIMEKAAQTLINIPKTTYANAVKALVESGLWEERPQGYQIHDYLEYNPSREQVLNERQKAKDRMNKSRGSGEVQTNINRSSPAPSRPNPLPEVPKEPKEEIESAHPRATRITSEFVEEMVTEFGPKLGGEERARECVAAALNHKAITKRIDKRAYLRGWLRRDAENYQSRNGHTTGPPINDYDKWERELAWLAQHQEAPDGFTGQDSQHRQGEGEEPHA